MPRYLANCSMLFTERPLLERPAAARAAGFDAIELWWPWPDQPVPADRDVDTLVAAVKDAGVQLVGLNFFAGDLAGPDCGVLSIPQRAQEFLDNIEVTVGIGERLAAHVQVADWPGRGEPGSGELDLDHHLADLAGRGYDGWVGLEYKPTTTTTEDSLAWLGRARASRSVRSSS